MATTLSSLNSLPIADVGTRSENWALMINNLFSYINTLEAGTATHPNVVTAALKLTTGGGANKILTSDADGDASWASALPAMSAIETGTLKVTTGAGANKILASDADGDLTYTLTPNLTSLEIDTLKVTTSAGANKILVSDADGDLTYSLTPNLTSVEVDTLKVTTGAAANKILVSDADGDLTYSNTPTLSTLEVGTVKITGGSPGASKVLTSDAEGDATWETAAGGGGGDFSDGGDAGGAARTLGNTDSYSLGFETNNVTRMIITAAGDVGIGATPAANEFKVQTPAGGNLEFNVGGTSKFEVTQYGMIRAGYSYPAYTAGLHLDIGDTSVVSYMFSLISTRADAYGQMHKYFNRSPSPAASDTIWSIDIHGNGARTTYMTTSGKVKHRIVSPGTATGTNSRTVGYQSEWLFEVCNNVTEAGEYDNATATNAAFTINYQGQGVDASAAHLKNFADGYEDRWGTICEKVQELAINPWQSANAAANGAWAFGASAEDFYETFELGEEPGIVTNKNGDEEYRAGIRPGDPAFLALAAVKELHARVKALEEA